MDVAPSLDWIMRIIDDKEAESAILDFKAALPGVQASDRKKFLADVVALANTRGGQIIYGIAEVNSFADKVIPITDVASEDARQRLTEMIQRGIEPPIRGVTIDSVDVDNGYVLVLTVDQQFGAGPFRTSFDDSHRFMYREGTQNFNMPYSLLRNAFGARAAAVENLINWHAARVQLLGDQIERKVIAKAPWLVLHVLPFASFIDPVSISPKEFRRRGHHFNGHPGNARYNLDGIRFYLGPSEAETHKYVQYFRNGVAEAGRRLWRSDEDQKGTPTMHMSPLSEDVRTMMDSVVQGLVDVGVVGEAQFFVSILNAEGWRTSVTDEFGTNVLPNDIPSKAVLIPPATADIPLDQATFNGVTKEILDIVWQMAGEDGCPHFDGDGGWVAPRR